MKLTDFNSPRWKGVDMESVSKCVGDLRERDENNRLFGELDHPEKFEVSLTNASHMVKNVQLKDGVVHGDVKFLDNEKGATARELIESGACVMGVRAAGTTHPDGTITITKIFSWDVITPNP